MMMRVLRIILEVLFWSLMAAVALLMVNVVMGWLFTPVLGYIGIAGLLVLVPLVTKIVRVVRRRRAAVIVGYIEQAVRLNLPLGRILAAARRSERGTLAYRLEQFRRRVEAGFSIGDAAQRVLPELPDQTTTLLISAERLGRLPHALRRTLNEQTRLAHQQASTGAFAQAYPFMMIITLLGVTLMICIYVLPKFETVFSDFKIRMPPMTMMLARLAEGLGGVLFVAALTGVLVWAGLRLWETFYPPRRLRFSRGVRDRILWSLPVVHGVVRDRGLAVVLDLVSDALRGGATTQRAMSEAATLAVNEVLRQRIEQWAAALKTGASLHDGAKAARMPALVVEMLATLRGPETADVLAFLSRHYATRFSRSAAILSAAAVPIVVLIFAALVAWVCLSLFVPISMLIDHLSTGSERWQL